MTGTKRSGQAPLTSDICHLASEPPAWTQRFIGIPFADLGRDRRGCDCYGAGRLVMLEERGVALPLYQDYEDARDGQGIARLLELELAEQARAWRPVAGPLEAFDWLVLRRMDPAGRAIRFHLALYAGAGWAFHTFSGGCTTNERLDSNALRVQGTLVGRYRFQMTDARGQRSEPDAAAAAPDI